LIDQALIVVPAEAERSPFGFQHRPSPIADICDFQLLIAIAQGKTWSACEGVAS
jgi:hypothetical protein